SGDSAADCPLNHPDLLQAANVGMLPLTKATELAFVAAPSLVDSRRIIAEARSGGDLIRRIRITSAPRLRAFVTERTRRYVAHQAATQLSLAHPELSASSKFGHRVAVISATGAAIAAFALAPTIAMTTTEMVLGLIFLAWTGLRFL